MARSNVVQKPATVGENIEAHRAGWTFGGDVADTFVSHVSKSVPLYEAGHNLVCEVSDFFVQQKSICYELGVSTGELLAKLATYNAHKPEVRWIGVDCEAAMVNKAEAHCSKIKNVELVVDDLTTMELQPGSDFIVAYYCIQFIPPRLRQSVFDKIYQSLNWGGAFLLFEKVRGPDARFQDIMTALYNDFKTRQGYNDDEIMSKSRSLRGVLEPYTSQANLDYLERAGFKDTITLMKYVCFEGFLAIK